MTRRCPTRRTPSTSAATVLLGLFALRSCLPAFVGLFSSRPAGRHFAVVRSAAPDILEPPTIVRESPADAPDSAKDSEGRQDKNKTASNATLQLSSGIPEVGNSRLGGGPSWAKCVVEQSTSGGARIILEEWVMRGERENVNAFRSWRENGKSPATARCA